MHCLSPSWRRPCTRHTRRADQAAWRAQRVRASWNSLQADSVWHAAHRLRVRTPGQHCRQACVATTRLAHAGSHAFYYIPCMQSELQHIPSWGGRWPDRLHACARRRGSGRDTIRLADTVPGHMVRPSSAACSIEETRLRDVRPAPCLARPRVVAGLTRPWLGL